jgi:hypothetical protein
MRDTIRTMRDIIHIACRCDMRDTIRDTIRIVQYDRCAMCDTMRDTIYIVDVTGVIPDAPCMKPYVIPYVLSMYLIDEPHVKHT